MILTPNDLPSKGEYGSQSTLGPLHFRPLNFHEILEYSNEVTGTEIKEYMRDIRWLCKLDPNVLNHSLYDLEYLIFMMKVHTISDTKEFQTDIQCHKCAHKNRIDIGLEDFTFKDVEPKSERVQRVLLNGFKYSVKVPTIRTFLEVLNKYSIYQKSDRVDIPKLISLFPEFETMPNDIEYAVLNAEKKDISILYLLETNYLSCVNPISRTCEKCNVKGGMVIGISSLITDMFRDVLLNNTIGEHEVQFE